MENSDIFVKVLLNDKVKLEPKYLHKNYKQEILKRLQQKLENICTKHGFIKSNSIEIFKIKPGLVELVSLNGFIQYDVYFYAYVCNPLVGSMINCKVTNTNRFGILAETGSILEIIIAKNSVSILSDVNLDEVKVGDNIVIEVMGKKYELNDKKISIVGRIVKGNSSTKKKAVTNNSVTNEDDEESNVEDALPTEDDEDENSTVKSESEVDDDIETDDDVDETDDDTDDDISVKKKTGGNLFSDDEDAMFEDDDIIDINSDYNDDESLDEYI